MEEQLNSNISMIFYSVFTSFPKSKYYDIYRYGTSQTDFTRYHLENATTKVKG